MELGLTLPFPVRDQPVASKLKDLSVVFDSLGPTHRLSNQAPNKSSSFYLLNSFQIQTSVRVPCHSPRQMAIISHLGYHHSLLTTPLVSLPAFSPIPVWTSSLKDQATPNYLFSCCDPPTDRVLLILAFFKFFKHKFFSASGPLTHCFHVTLIFHPDDSSVPVLSKSHALRDAFSDHLI